MAGTYHIEPLHPWTGGQHKVVKISLSPSATGPQLTRRDKRSVVIGDSWPPPSRDNWVEVMVVVDGTILKYHGNSVRHYVLTLMQIVSLTLLVLLM